MAVLIPFRALCSCCFLVWATADWVVELSSTGEESVGGVAVDSAANPIVAVSSNTAVVSGLTLIGQEDIFVLKYDDAGTLQSQWSFGTTAKDVASCMTVDSSDNILVAGATDGEWPGQSQTNPSGFENIVLFKLNSAGSQQWAVQLDDVGVVNSVAVDSAQNVILGGDVFGDLAGSPAPILQSCAYVPEVIKAGVVRQRMQWAEFAAFLSVFVTCYATWMSSMIGSGIPLLVFLYSLCFGEVWQFAFACGLMVLSLLYCILRQSWKMHYCVRSRVMGGRRHKQRRSRADGKMWSRTSHGVWRSSIACLPLVFHFVLGVGLSLQISFREGDEDIHSFAVMSFIDFAFLPPRWCIHMFLVAIWFRSQKQMNRLSHILHGNGPPGYGRGSSRPMDVKGSGKGKGKQNPVVDPEADFVASMKAAIPVAARIRMQSKLVQSEWDVSVQEPQSLTAQGGVAICPKDLLPTVLANVGYTGRPCAVVVVQNPDSLGLYGYPRAKIKCSFDVLADGAERKRIVVDRYLVQLGFSTHVTMTALGDEIHVKNTMTKMVARFSQIRGWGSGTHPAAILVSFLEKLVDSHAFTDVVAREGSFTFLVHESYVDILLCASGTDGIFIKVHADECREKMELLWIDEEIPLTDALLSAQDPTVFGLAEKGQKGRLALRFKTVADLEKFAQANGVSGQVLLPRWKVTGVPVTSGIAGLSSLLQKLGWDVDQIIYHDSDHAVFTSTNKGKDAPAHFRTDGQPRSIQFKAVNSLSRALAKAESQASRATLFRKSEVASAQRAFLARVEKADTQTSSPRQLPQKAKATDPTGGTPEGQRQRSGQS